MQFLIADTFYTSLGRLANTEQRETKICAFEIQADPKGKGKSFHKIEKSRDKNFWSVRVNRDIRIIVHQTDERLVLCYVDHHDKAYLWAERRKLEIHPETHAAQIVEVRELVQEIITPHYIPSQARPLFAQYPDHDLLRYGVPQEWLADIRSISNEDHLLQIAAHLPAEAGEALLTLFTGGTPKLHLSLGTNNPFEHPDAQRRFRILKDTTELEEALAASWERWVIFLHPEQRAISKRQFNGPARISGSAGTGKTVLALHRAVELARRYEDARILVTTISKPLTRFLDNKLRHLLTHEQSPRLKERIDVRSLDEMGIDIYQRRVGPIELISENEEVALIEYLAEQYKSPFTPEFLYDEWHNQIDAWNIYTWDDYRNVPRLGRKISLSAQRRELVWNILSQMRQLIAEQGKITKSELFAHLCQLEQLPYDYVIFDEAQDISVYHLRFLQHMIGERVDGLFFVGDLGQRIFQQPFSWRACGVDIRGRSHTLKVNYRTSHQIRRQADLLLDPSLSDYDNNTESRKHTISVFNGPDPIIQTYDDADQEIDQVASYLQEWHKTGISTSEIGVFVRSEQEIPRALAAVQQAGLAAHKLDHDLQLIPDHVAVSTMHLAKGLEFRAVLVMACDNEVIPSQERIEQISDESDLDEVYNTERYLLYIACTRARDQLLVTGVSPASDFLEDLRTLSV
jgi:superfamily I DNA/RNA helicase